MANKNVILSTAASLVASAMLIQSIVRDFLPHQLCNFLFSFARILSHRFSSQLTVVVEEFQGYSMNQVFEAAEIYLGSKQNSSVRRVKVGKSEKEANLAVNIDRNEEAVDVFENVEFKWIFVTTQVEASMNVNHRRMVDLNSSLRSEVRHFELSFHRKQKDKAFGSHFPYILEKAMAIREERKVVNLYSANGENWCFQHVLLNHPMNFKTLAIDSKLKKELLEDLDNFMNGKEYYKRIGKAWKRGYFLYGPPGTGKTSLIAAMSNHLKFDIYNLDLTDIQNDSHLRFFLLRMSSQAIIVVEDIDCSIKLQNRDSPEDQKQTQGDNNGKVTLSGLLNFVDGLYSYCGEGRIMILTTNYKEKLDPALLRPGRMDMHICLSYCNASVFDQLAFNYLGLHQHHLFDEIKRLIEEIEVTPAELGGELMKSRDPQVSLQGLLSFLHNKKIQQHSSSN
ncbi:protein HYPER-SENSITIVITY-RELATED 4 [Ziziphus jujuba]|uniref:Protein HYPER-SENSITIVITY-RELATED 4 n=1 Tax=Ziziphus jujuba TaxID=326968 RepID=A0A6P6GJI1_ZIZJJ|nr:protein HYPER-SENSITIVITY-RELATED 4 [Ziziphus jujuba]